jgi:hypothetical protein
MPVLTAALAPEGAVVESRLGWSDAAAQARCARLFGRFRRPSRCEL